MNPAARVGTSRVASSSAPAGRIESNGVPGTAAWPASARIVVTVPSAGAVMADLAAAVAPR